MDWLIRIIGYTILLGIVIAVMIWRDRVRQRREDKYWKELRKKYQNRKKR